MLTVEGRWHCSFFIIWFIFWWKGLETPVLSMRDPRPVGRWNVCLNNWRESNALSERAFYVESRKSKRKNNNNKINCFKKITMTMNNWVGSSALSGEPSTHMGSDKSKKREKHRKRYKIDQQWFQFWSKIGEKRNHIVSWRWSWDRHLKNLVTYFPNATSHRVHDS